MKKSRLLGAVFIYVITVSQPAWSALVLDQEYIAPSSPGLISGVGAADFAQTFTVGIDGHISAIEVDIRNVEGNQDSLFFDLRSVVDGKPVEDAVRNRPHSVPSLPGPLWSTKFRRWFEPEPRRTPFGVAPPSPVTSGGGQKRPSAARTAPLSAIPGMSMPQPPA